MRYDLIIIGGGLVGASLATALRDTELHIALIDARVSDSPDSRLFALNNSSCQFLNNLGIWPQLESQAALIREVQVSNQGHFGSIRLHCDEVKLAALGYVIPASHIETALHAALLNAPNVTCYRPAKLKTLNQDENLATAVIETDNGDQTLHSTIVIGADGTESTVRSQLNIATSCFDYQQSAIVTRCTLQRAHQHIAYERFTDDGAIAMLPLAAHEYATIWSVANEKAAQLMALDDAVFLQRLQKEFGYRLGRFKRIDSRFIYPLRMLRAEKNVTQHIFLLGNAAHTLHPIAAQGLNLALYEVAALVEAIQEKQAAFTAHDLEQISAQIERQQTASIGLSHRLPQLFSSKSVLMNMLLSLGMVGFNTLPSIKKRFIQRMLGRTGRVPRLLMYEPHL